MVLTKIIATIGPASENEKILIQLVKNGVNLFRLNLKHNLPAWHNLQIKKIKKISNSLKKPLGLILDIPGSENFNSKETFKNYLKSLSRIAISEVDFLAVSFVKKAEEIEMLKDYLVKKYIKAKIIAKIEAKQALSNFKKILDVSDGILIARGDLASQISYQKVPYYQKIIIKKCMEVGKPCIVATQMLASMVHSSFPTRAEISDVANAVLDYTDAVMLSEETALGKHPERVVKTMEKICRFWEKKRPLPLNFKFLINDQTSAISYSAFQLWNSDFCKKQRIKSFLILSRTGFTARMLSRLRPTIPILTLTNQKFVCDQLSLSYGVIPVLLNIKNIYYHKDLLEVKKILEFAKKTFSLATGERIIFIFAEDWGKFGRANVLRIQNIP